MSDTPKVLIIDDQVGDLYWLLDLLESKGYGVALATNEKEGRERLEAVAQGRESYALGIVDVMMAVSDLFSLPELDDRFFEDSRDAGIRLCEHARRELQISAETLPLVCLTVREDEQVRAAMGELDILLFNRVPHEASESIRVYLDQHLPTL